MVIKSNIAAFNATRQNGLVNKAFSKKTEKLSSGYKINRAADDAAGLSISEKMRRQIRGLTQASTNAEEGISYIQTAEGALNEVHDLLQRGNELCVKAGNDTNTDVDRDYIQAEIDQIRAEIDRIAMDTSFNEMNVFDSANAGDRNAKIAPWQSNILSGIPDVTRYDAMDYNGIVQEAQNHGINFLNAANLQQFSTDLKDTYLPQILNHIQSALPSAQPPLDGLEIGLKYYYEDNSTLAYVASNGVGYELGINMKYLTGDASQITVDGDMATTIAHEMMHGVMFDMVTNGMLGYNGGDSFPGWFVEGSAQAVGGAMNYIGQAEIYMNNDAQLSNWLSELTDGGYASYAQGYIGAMYLGYVAGGEGTVDSATIADGLNDVLGHIADGYSLSQTINILSNGKYDDLADFENSFATDAVQFTKDLFTAAGANGAGSIIAGSLSAEKTQILTGSTSTTNNYFILNIDEGGYVSNSSKYTNNGVDPYTGGGATTTNGSRADGSINPDADKTWGSGSTGNGANVSKSSGSLLSFIQVGAEAGQHIDINRYKLSAKDLGVDNVKVNSRENAGTGIKRFKAAIESVSQIRSDYGAVQNRLEHTVKNLDNVVENVTASESRIRDTDMAKMMVGYSNDNILLQAGQAMMAQANQANRGVLSLLG